MSIPKPNNPSAKAPAAKAGAAPPGGTPVVQPKPVVPPLFRGIDWLTFAITTFLVFIGYWWTLAPDLTLEDSGELAVGSYYAGIPHPPGYPVWTIYSWLFTLLPISNIAYRVGLSSAVAAALSCGLVGLMVSRGSSMLMEGIAELKAIERRSENLICVVAGFVAGMLIGFNGFMWSQAVIVEVYTLSVLSLAGVMVCLMRWIYAPHQHRYLYFAFFWFGICFNNHQSLLVIALGLEVAIIAVQPKLGRDLLFWNVVIWGGGLVGKEMGLITTLNDNAPLLLIYNLIGVGSLVGWIYLLFRTKKTWLELGRDFALVASIGYVLVVFGTITSYATLFYYRDALVLKTGPFILFNLVGLAVVGVYIYLIVATKGQGKEWLYSLVSGGAWSLGAAFYLYMPLAGMSNPPMQWGYPRTVQGFFHAFTRGQYERIHPTFGQGTFFDQIERFVGQIWMYSTGVLEEFNLVYVLIGLLPFLFYKRMQKRERGWLIAVTAIYICLGFFLLVLLNPAADRQSRDLNKVFFTASHVMIAMGVGYGLALLAALLVMNYQKFRGWALAGFAVASMIALWGVAEVFWTTLNPLERFTAVASLVLALAAVAVLALSRERVLLKALLAVFALMPFWSIFSHWERNEQRGHYFGYWFGHDMFTPPFGIYPEMDRDTVLYGGTDPGRFNPTYMIFCESFIGPQFKPRDPVFDRRDVCLITQNALADGTYLNYIRAHYNKSDQVQYDTPFFQELMRGERERALGSRTNFIARMAIPLDTFFLNLGDRIEKRRRAGSSFFLPQDFTDLGSLAQKLKNDGAPSGVSKYLREGLSPETREQLGGAADARLAKALARDLNRLLDDEYTFNRQLPQWRQDYATLTNEMAVLKQTAKEGTGAFAKAQQRVEQVRQKIAAAERLVPFYMTNRFEGVTLSDHVQKFIKQNPQLHSRIRLNRLLLEAAYPKEIAKSKGGVYPDREILTANPDDSQRAFSEYLADAQRRLDHDRRFPNEPKQIRPGEDVRMIDNRVQVSGQVAVMSINAILTKIMFDKNPGHEFYVEESFPLDWMYPYLTPFGIIMKINRQPLLELGEDIVKKDHEFWSKYSERLIGNWVTYDTPISNICYFADQVYVRRNYRQFNVVPEFLRDDDGQKAFSKLRSSIAGVYNWRFATASGKLREIQMKPPAEQQALLPEIQRLSAEQQRMLKEADFAFKQAYAFCPYSPEAVFRYITLLVNVGRVDDALLLAKTSHKLDPYNAQIDGLISELEKIKKSQAGFAPPPPPPPAPPNLARMEQEVAAAPSNLPAAYQLVEAYIQAQQAPKALALVDKLLDSPLATVDTFVVAAQTYNRLGQMAGVEKALNRLVKASPENPEVWFDLAAIQAIQNNQAQALASLRQALTKNAQRLAKEPNARNLYDDAANTNDARFAGLRQTPEFKKLLAELKPAPK